MNKINLLFLFTMTSLFGLMSHGMNKTALVLKSKHISDSDIKVKRSVDEEEERSPFTYSLASPYDVSSKWDRRIVRMERLISRVFTLLNHFKNASFFREEGSMVLVGRNRTERRQNARTRSTRNRAHL